MNPNASNDIVDINQEDSEPLLEVKKPSKRKRRSRSVFVIPDQYKESTIVASNYIRYFTFFENPMLNGDEMDRLLIEAWADTMKTTGKKLEQIDVVESHVGHEPPWASQTAY